MKKLTDKKLILGLTLLCAMVYFTSYITRINYAAVLVEIIKSKGITKAAASMAITGSFITYGAGQIISGYLGDKIKPRYLLFGGFLITASMNLAVPFAVNAAAITAAWCVNGFAQALMWPPLVKMLTSMLDNDEYTKASIRVSYGSCIGTIIIYLLSPFIIEKSGWETLFYICASAAIIMSGIWFAGSAYYEKITGFCMVPAEKEEYKKEDKKEAPGQKFDKLSLLMLAGVMLTVALEGVMKDGISTWMPTFVSDTFNLGSGISILTGVILPVFTIIFYNITSYIHNNFFKNEITCIGVLFAFSFAGLLLLSFFYKVSPVFSVILFTLISGSMHGIGLLGTCIVPLYFKKTGRISLVSGFINSSVYVGSAVSTYGIAVAVDKSGSWSSAIIIWAVVAFCGGALCFAITKAWKKFKHNV